MDAILMHGLFGIDPGIIHLHIYVVLTKLFDDVNHPRIA